MAGVAGRGEEAGRLALPSVPMQTWEREEPPPTPPHATQVPAVVCRPRGVEAEAAGSPGAEPEPQWVLAESREPRFWAPRCGWVAPALPTLRRELNSVPLARLWRLSWRAQLEFFMEPGTKLPWRLGRVSPKLRADLCFPGESARQGKELRIFGGVF